LLIFVLASRLRDSISIIANAAPNAVFLFKTRFFPSFFFFFSEKFYFRSFERRALAVVFVAVDVKIDAGSARRRVKMTAPPASITDSMSARKTKIVADNRAHVRPQN